MKARKVAIVIGEGYEQTMIAESLELIELLRSLDISECNRNFTDFFVEKVRYVFGISESAAVMVSCMSVGEAAALVFAAREEFNRESVLLRAAEALANKAAQ